MKEISKVWTVVYKDATDDPKSFTYTSEKDANEAKIMIEGSDGEDLINEKGEADGQIELEWCYLIEGKLIDGNKSYAKGSNYYN